MNRQFLEMCEFLSSALKRPLSDKELHFVAWLSSYEKMTYEQVFDLFKELSAKR